jgi:hypothetical protein
MKKREDHEPPMAIEKWGWRFHHLGVPTTFPQSGEKYLEQLKIHVKGFDSSPFGIEWMRFDEDSPVSDLIKTLPHIAFEVDDLDQAIQGFEVIYEPGIPSEGVRAAMILYDGAPVELIEFAKNSHKKNR